MHYVHLIAVEAENAADAIAAAEEALNSYGDGVWDWYEIGGRWDGSLNGENALRYSDHPEMFIEAIESCKRARNRTMLDIIQKLKGQQLAPGEVHDTLGLGIPDPEGAAKRISDHNLETKREFDALLESDDPVSLCEERGTSMLGYYLRKLGTLMAGYYDTESYFYDAVAYDPAFRFVGARVKTDPRTQWLVVADLHN